ncbi:MAG: MerR family transcriptional regulator [Kamptonema sp. SIO4C4]|nr:MerR family transcriptional regulator [Kamptonema sp. SIO4C4]
MENRYFSTKEAATLTGCTVRQLQYWREKGVIVPTVSATGTGRSIYYSSSQLLELAVMEYWLSLGLTFEVAAGMLLELKEKEPDLGSFQQTRRFMLCGQEKRRLELREFNREGAIASLDQGQAVIPLWLDRLEQQLKDSLKRVQ